MGILAGETTTTMTAIDLTDGERGLHVETEVCHPVIDSPGSGSTRMKTAAGETIVTIAIEIETETGAIATATASEIKTEIGIGIERGVATGAAGIGMITDTARD